MHEYTGFNNSLKEGILTELLSHLNDGLENSARVSLNQPYSPQ